MDSLKTIRDQFPIVRDYVYFDHAAACPISKRVATAMTGLIDDHLHHAMAHYQDWQQHYQDVREKAARLLDTTVSQVAFIKSTTEGLSIAANGIRWQQGDSVIVPEMEFPTNYYPWLNLEGRGVEVRPVKARDGRISVDDIRAQIDRRTRAVALSVVQFSNGFRSDLAQIGELCRAHDLLFVADGIQALGALQVYPEQCGIDVLAADAHKWLLGPFSIGLLYCSPRALAQLDVTTVGWLSVKEPFQFHYRLDLLDDARRFEPATENNVGLYGLGAALDLLLDFGLERIEGRVLALTDRLCEGLRSKGYRVLSPRDPGERSGIVVFDHPQHDNEALYARLQAANILLSVRGGGVRASPHFYNDETEIAHLLDTLP